MEKCKCCSIAFFIFYLFLSLSLTHVETSQINQSKRKMHHFTILVATLIIIITITLSTTTTTTTNAQHLIRKLSTVTASGNYISLQAIGGLEILPSPSSTASLLKNQFTIASSSNIFVYAVTFQFNQLLSQIPFTCGTTRVNCRMVKCYITCANVTYSIALRCNDVNNIDFPVSPWRIVAMSQDRLETFDDVESVTLKVAQRFKSGTKCQFAFANELLGRTSIAGRLQGSVVLTVARTLPFASGIPFHPPPTTWNETHASTMPTTTTGAYVRCTRDGTITYIADAQATSDTTANSNWTSACCYSFTTNRGDCTVQYSDQPAFYDASIQKTVWSNIDTKIATTSTLSAASTAACGGSSTSRALRYNASIVNASGFLTNTVFGTSLLKITRLSQNSPSTTEDPNAIGVFMCYDGSSTSIEYLCAIFASNSSVVTFTFPSNYVYTTTTATLTPICESVQTQQSPVGPFDDAATTTDRQPFGACYYITSKTTCTSPCIWSDAWNLCVWSDAFGANSAVTTNVLQRSAPCLWPVPNATSTIWDLSCRLSR